MNHQTHSLSPVVREELAKLENFKKYLPAEVLQQIMRRTALDTPIVNVPPASHKTPAAVPHVARPGIPPRPLDPFFFEVITDKKL